MNGRYTMGGYGGPSEQIPPDTGGVQMRAPAALPFNRTPNRTSRVPDAEADDPVMRRRLPFYALGLGLAIIALAAFVSPMLSIALLGGALPFAALILWLRWLG